MSIKSILFSAILAIGAVALAAGFSVGAVSPLAEQQICENSGGTYSGGNCSTPGKPQTVEGTFQNIINAILFIIGAIAVIMVIYGGIRYVTSGGDQTGVNNAKNTILYAIIGVVISFAAYGIINFVISSII